MMQDSLTLPTQSISPISDKVANADKINGPIMDVIAPFENVLLFLSGREQRTLYRTERMLKVREQRERLPFKTRNYLSFK